MAESKFVISEQLQGSFDQTQLKIKGASANDLTIKPNETLGAARILNLIVNNADRTINLGGNLTLANAFSTSGAFALTLTTTAATNVTLPTTGTLSTLAGTETLANKTFTTPIVETSIGTTSTTFSVFDTTAATINAFRAAAVANIAYSEADNSTTNFVTGINASGKTKAVNIATGGASGSITNVIIASSIPGSVNNITLNGLINGGLGTPPNTSSLNGTWIGWNASNGYGESVFANYRQGGSGGFDFRIYSNAATLVATPLQIKESSVDINVTSLRFNNSTSAFAYFGVGGAGVPAFTTRSVGTKSVYCDTLSPTSVDYARGISASTLWDSIPESTSDYSYKLFAGTTQVLQIKGNGDMSLIGDFNGKYISLEDTNPSIKFKETGFTDVAGIFFKTSGTGDANYLGFTGSASDSKPLNQTLGFKVTQNGRCIAVQPSAGLGYGIEATSSVTQLTNKNTAVSMTTLSGQITTANTNLSTTAALFTVNLPSGLLESRDVVHVFVSGVYTSGAVYRPTAVSATSSNSFQISIVNIGTAAAEAVVINYIIIRGGSA